ncbi:hypothetical protein GCM10009087_04820 [Sphingomonas oligophenolica]
MPRTEARQGAIDRGTLLDGHIQGNRVPYISLSGFCPDQKVMSNNAAQADKA